MILLPRSLRGRLLASAALFIVLALLATGVAVRFALHRFVQGQIDQRLDGQILTIEDALEPQPDGTIRLGRTIDGPPFDNARTGWFWVARTGRQTWLSRGLSGDDPGPVPAPTPSRHPLPFDGPGPGGRPMLMRAKQVQIGANQMTIIAAAPLDALNGPLRDAMIPLTTALVVLGSGLVLATLIQVRLGLRPLADLQQRLAEVRAGRIERLPARQPAELRPLVAEMNSLLDENAVNLERARRHVANLAHGLKTPLAALTLALGQPGRDPDHTLLGLAVAMDRRIRHHLMRARAAALGMAARSSLPLASRLADHVSAFAKIYADKAVACRTMVAADVSVACEAQDLDEMIGNVLDNAFKWARSAVDIRAAAEGKVVQLIVEDDGPGVPAAELDAVLRPGQRLDESVPGDGFGLGIIQELAELYGGGVALSIAPLGGLRVTLTLPAATAV